MSYRLTPRLTGGAFGFVMAIMSAAAAVALVGGRPAWADTATATPAAPASPSAEAVKIATDSADAAKKSADEAKEAADKAKKAIGEAKDTDGKIKAIATSGAVSGKAEDAAKAAKAAAEAKDACVKAGADVAKALESAAAAKGAADDAAAAAKAAKETLEPPAKPPATADKGDTAWMLISTALVMLMVPGLALFYAGMVRSKNVLGTMMHSMVALAIIGVEWVIIGYAMAFGATKGATSELIDYSKEVEEGKPGVTVTKMVDGKPVTGKYGAVVTETVDGKEVPKRSAGLVGFQSSFLWMKGVGPWHLSDDQPLKDADGKELPKYAKTEKDPGQNPGAFATTIPAWLHMLFQGMFAIITPALISGAIAERVRFIPYCIFIALWGLIIYNPLAHWVWGNGLLGMDGVRALDFAGGTVVHLSAGISALACILLLPKRKDYPDGVIKPNNIGLTLLGAGLLWFGWFGFNGGSALGSGEWATMAFGTTQTAAAAAGLSWALCELVHRGKPTAIGLASGIVAGLVGITPAAGFVDLFGALVIGFGVSIVCYSFCQLKPLFGYDDSLDVVGVHGVGGTFGALMTGVLFVATPYFPGFAKIGGEMPSVATQFMRQVKAVGLAGAYCFVVTCVLVLALKYTIGFSTSEEEEETGLDLSQHGEAGYHL